MFLKDGKIRGITPDGDVFEHRISSELSKQFIQRLKGIHIRGMISPSLNVKTDSSSNINVFPSFGPFGISSARTPP
jgi:hypothetical protein